MSMKLFIIIGVAFVMAVSSAAYAAVPHRVAVANDPTAVEVQRAALAYHNIDNGEVQRWKKRARLAALLPRFQVGYDQNIKNDVNVDINENVYVGSSGVTVGPDESSYQQNANTDRGFEVKAVWYLNELIFNPDQLDISREARNIMREKQMVLAEVNRHYYERKKFAGIIEQIEKGGKPIEVKDKKGTVRLDLFNARIKHDEETAALDALTGGWFSRRIGG
jgi:hypothetical protein